MGGTYLSAPQEFRQIQLVRDLIDMERKWWNTTILEANYEPRDIEKIKTISLGRLTSPDQPMWKAMRSSSFSVKYAYHLVVSEQRRGDEAEHSGQHLVEGCG